MDTIYQFLVKLIGFNGAAVAMWLVAFNMLLSGVYKALAAVKDHTESKLDDKAYDIVGKIIGYVLKILDIVGYNPPNKKE